MALAISVACLGHAAPAAPLVVPPAITILGSQSALLARDFAGFDALPGYRTLIARKSAGASDIVVGREPPRLLVQEQETDLLRLFSLPEENAGEASAASISLKDVLLSIVNSRHDQPAVPRRASQNADDDDEYYFDLKKYLLENETLGGLLQSVVEPIPGEDGVKRFNVLGYGRWVAEADNNETLRLTEQSSGFSADIKVVDNAAPEPQPHSERKPEGKSTKQIIITAIIDFVTSPLGMFVLIVTAWILLFVAAAKFVVIVRPRRF
jgi:hypothetical protein